MSLGSAIQELAGYNAHFSTEGENYELLKFIFVSTVNISSAGTAKCSWLILIHYRLF